VPAEVFDNMMRLGREARGRATHTIAYAGPSGKPYLQHHAGATIRAAKPKVPETEVAEKDALPNVVLPSRPSSTCASEVMEDFVLPSRPSSACASEVMEDFRATEAMPVQVA